MIAVVNHIAAIVSPVIYAWSIVVPARKVPVVVLAHAGVRSVGDRMRNGDVEIHAILIDCRDCASAFPGLSLARFRGHASNSGRTAGDPRDIISHLRGFDAVLVHAVGQDDVFDGVIPADDGGCCKAKKCDQSNY